MGRTPRKVAIPQEADARRIVPTPAFPYMRASRPARARGLGEFLAREAQLAPPTAPIPNNANCDGAVLNRAAPAGEKNARRAEVVENERVDGIKADRGGA